MAAEREIISLTVIHGAKKYSVSLEGAESESTEPTESETEPSESQPAESQPAEPLNLQHLRAEIFSLTQVPCHNQKLIFKGKSLTENGSSLASLGIKSGSKVMVLGKKESPQDEALLQQLHQVEVSVQKLETKLRDLAKQLQGIQNGFLNKEHRDPALKKLSVQVNGNIEIFSRYLEELDGLLMGDAAQDVRTKRKQLVNHIQVLITKCDQASSEILELEAEVST